MENLWILVSVSALVLLLYAVLVEAFEEKLASHRCVVGKGRNIAIAFSDNYGSSFILHLDCSKWWFLKGWLQSGIWNHINALHPAFFGTPFH